MFLITEPFGVCSVVGRTIGSAIWHVIIDNILAKEKWDGGLEDVGKLIRSKEVAGEKEKDATAIIDGPRLVENEECNIKWMCVTRRGRQRKRGEYQDHSLDQVTIKADFGLTIGYSYIMMTSCLW